MRNRATAPHGRQRRSRLRALADAAAAVAAAVALAGCGASPGAPAASSPAASSPAASSPGASSPAPAPPADASAPPAAPDETGSPPDCSAAGLPVRVAARDGAAGLRVVVLRVTNCTGAPVAVEGYPGLQLLDADGDVIAVRTTHGRTGGITDRGPVELELERGAEAQATVSWRGTVTDGEVRTAEQVLVAPVAGPQDGGAAQDPAQAQVLREVVDLGTTGTIDVTAWEPAR